MIDGSRIAGEKTKDRLGLPTMNHGYSPINQLLFLK